MLLKLTFGILAVLCYGGRNHVNAKPHFIATAPVSYATPAWFAATPVAATPIAAAAAAYYPAYGAYAYTPFYGAYATYPYYLRR